MKYLQPQWPHLKLIQRKKTYNVTIKNFAFNPDKLTIKKGDTINWINKDSAPHSIKPNSSVAEIFDNSNTLNSGDSYNFTFAIPNTYEYACGTHSYMKGKIIVE